MPLRQQKTGQFLILLANHVLIFGNSATFQDGDEFAAIEDVERPGSLSSYWPSSRSMMEAISWA